jgi:tetratricopeptide (TPR) repeat protein
MRFTIKIATAIWLIGCACYGETNAVLIDRVVSSEVKRLFLNLPFSSIVGKIQMAMDDGMCDVAEKWLQEVQSSNKFVSTSETAQITFLMGQLRCLQGRFGEALAMFNRINTNSLTIDSNDLLLWKSVATAEAGDKNKALEIVRAIRSKAGEDYIVASAIQIEAEILKSEGRHRDAVKCYEILDKNYGNLPFARSNLLRWAKCLITIGELNKAADTLKRILTGTSDDKIAFEAKLQLCEIYLNNGDLEELRKIAVPLLEDKRIAEQDKLPVILAMIKAEEKQNGKAKAIELLYFYQSKMVGAEVKRILNLKKGELLVKNGKVDEGMKLIREYLVSNLDATINGEVMLNVAGWLLDEGLVESSIKEFQNCIETFSDSNGLYKAYSGKAGALIKLNRFQEAAAAYEKAAEYTASVFDKTALLMEAGNVLLQFGKYEAALKLYQKVIDLYPESHAAEESLIQVAKCYAGMAEKEKAIALLWELFDNSCDRAILVKVLLTISDIYYDANQKEIVLLLKKWALQFAKDTDILPEAYYAFGVSLYNAHNFQSAFETFSLVYTTFTNSLLTPDAMYMAGWSMYMLGDDEKTKWLFEKLINDYPSSSAAEKALYKIGELLFNEQKYLEAEKTFALFAQKYSASIQTENSLFWAGRSALKQREYKRALAFFAKMVTLYPEGNKIADGRFYQGEALVGLGDFSGAIVMFEEATKKAQFSELVKKALVRIGDCHFVLGRNDPVRYNEALLNYRKAFEMSGTDISLQIELFYKIGRSFEKMGKTQEALEAYLQSMYSFQDYASDDNAAQIWFVRAAFAAAEMKEAENNWRKAVEFYEKVARDDIPAAEDAKRRIEQIKSEHWLFFY